MKTKKAKKGNRKGIKCLLLLILSFKQKQKVMNNTEKILAKALLEEIQKINSKIETYKKLDLALDKLLEIKGAYYTIGEKVLNLPIDEWYEGRKELETIANS